MNANRWKEKTIGELCDFTNGYGFTPSEWSDKGLPIIRIQNLNGSGDFNYYEGAPDKRWIVMPGDLLFAWAGMKGVSFGPTIWKGDKGVLNQHIYRIHPKNGVNKEWLYYALRVTTDRIEAMAHGFKSTLLHVRKNDITEQKVALPDEPEQNEIAEILGCLAHNVEILEQLISTKNRLKRSLTRQLLTGRKRFREFEEKEIKSDEIRNFVKLVKDKYDPQSDGASHRCIELEHLSQESGRLLGFAESHGKASLKTRFKKGDVLFGKLRPYLRKYLLADFDGVCTTEIWALRAKPDACDSRYLFYIVQTNEFIQAANATSGSKMPRADWVWVSEVPIRLPSLAEQRRITALLNACDRELDLLRQQLAALKRQKHGLMRKLLTGQIRVKVDL